MKCNLDCSYCESGVYGGHDNSTTHPPLAECLAAVDFMFKYADLYMSVKPNGLKYVVLNVYGGEALHHPDIVEILQQVRSKYQTAYSDKWHLTITTTTNAIVNERKLNSIIPLIDEFTVSYHAENSEKNKQLFKNNLLAIKAAGQRQKCIIMMHSEQELFNECQAMINWLVDHDIKHLPKQLDHNNNNNFNYKTNQVVWFNKLYDSKGLHRHISATDTTVDLANEGRPCCGGRQLCSNQNYKQKQFFVDNKFPDWFCSVNHFFLFVKQVTGEVFVNKDCKMNFDGTVSPMGLLSNAQDILDKTSNWIDTDTMPVIQCKKINCLCGLCAPKAQTLEDYNKIFKKYIRK